MINVDVSVAGYDAAGLTEEQITLFKALTIIREAPTAGDASLFPSRAWVT
jgi:hypothetical protein